MASTDYLPSREAELVTWTQTFSTLISAAPTSYGLSAAQATAFATLKTNWVNTYNTANSLGTRTSSAVAAKNTAKAAVIANARLLVRIVQATPTVTDAQKTDLGITVRDSEPSPIPPPATAPDIDIISVISNTVRIRLHEAGDSSRRGKPAGVAGAAIFSYIGTTPPPLESDWTFEGLTTLTQIDINFPAETPAGSQVWLTAFWRNPRDQSGPAATRRTTNLQGIVSMAA
jgi:hypothetical protein